jgi:hypothetical protein
MRVETAMEWPEIIEKHRQALRDVLAGLVVLAACLGGGPGLPRHLRLAISAKRTLPRIATRVADLLEEDIAETLARVRAYRSR